MKSIRKLFESAINLKFKAGEDLGVGGGADATPEPPAPPDLFAGFNLPDELRNDPEMIDLMNDQKPPADPAIDPEKKPVAEPKVDPVEPKKPEAADDDKFTFEADVQVGDLVFKKESLANLPNDVLENLGNLKTKMEDLNQQVTSKSQEVEEFLKDPVIAFQAKRIAEGRGAEPLPMVGVTKETQTALLSTLQDKHGLTKDEATDVFNSVKAEIEADIKFNVEHAVKNSLGEFKQTVEAKENRSKGCNLLSQVNDMLAKVKPEIALKDADMSKIIELGEKHPQYLAFKNGPGKFFDYWTEKLGSWSKFAQMSPEEIYAPVAAKLGLPVAINTKARDEKIALSEREKAINALGAKRVAKAMSQRSAPASTTGTQASIDNLSGIDKSKLNDPEYIENLITGAKSDTEVFQIQQFLKSSDNN
jgi:hypothetical protein